MSSHANGAFTNNGTTLNARMRSSSTVCSAFKYVPYTPGWCEPLIRGRKTSSTRPAATRDRRYNSSCEYSCRPRTRGPFECPNTITHVRNAARCSSGNDRWRSAMTRSYARCATLPLAAGSLRRNSCSKVTRRTIDPTGTTMTDTAIRMRPAEEDTATPTRLTDVDTEPPGFQRSGELHSMR